jgi:hypothetical protein
MEELTGQLVLVHPELTQDPVSRQGQIGVIATADLKSDTITVGFGSIPLGKYATDALLVLKEKNALFDYIMNHPLQLDKDSFQQLFRINMLQEQGTYASISKALQMVAAEPSLVKHSMISLEDQLSQHQNIGASREDVGR